MRRTVGWLGVVSLAFGALGVSVTAQTPPDKPGPEHKKLSFFVGKWTTDSEMKPSPFGPGGKMTSTDTCEWFEGGFAVVCSYEGKAPTGPTKGIGIMGYSADQKVYTYYAVDNSAMTMTGVPRGTVQGDTWTYDDESTIGGQKIKSRYTIKEVSPDAYTFRWEAQGPDGKWAAIAEGKATKAK